MYRSANGWVLLPQHEAAAGVVVTLEGSGARVVGLPADASEYWFAVRARNVWGVSVWSESIGAAVPVYAQAGAVVFDPFTAPTLSGIDLERLREAVSTVTPGRAGCSMVTAMDVAGISVVDPPATLGDVDAELAVAEVVRIAGGCLVVAYVALAGRTVNEVRALLEAEPSVHAVGAPVRGLSLESHGGDHIDDGGGEQWHLAEGLFKDDLWKNWVATSPVTVAVLDTGVDSSHPDLDDQIVAGGLTACHRVDFHGHGTHVAGIIAAEHDRRPGAVNGHVAGVAPDADILSIRVLERAACEPSITATAAVVAAVNAGAQIINMSFKWPLCERETGTVGGLPVEADDEDECDPAMYDSGDADDSFELALRAASMLGVVAITSVGNDGQDADDTGPRNQRNGPAVYPDVISVAAFDSDEQRSLFSTANDLVDIAAPGGKILSTVPLSACNAEDTDGDTVSDRWTPLECGTGDGSRDPLTECPNSEPRRIRSTEDPPASGCAHRVFEKSGTSMASPFVAGVVAHMLNRHPQADVGQVRRALEETAVMPPAADKTAYPSGSWMLRVRDGDDKLSPRPTQEYGRGIVDPAEAVAMLGDIVFRDEAADAGGFEAVATGGRFSCGLRSSGRVRCWGQSGVLSHTPGLSFAQVSVPTGPADHACGINISPPEDVGPRVGGVLCWSAAGPNTPRVVLGSFDRVVTGFAASCGLRPSESVVCWGNDTGERRAAPGGEFEEISGGWLHFCGRRGDGTVECWGDSADGKTDVPEGVAFRTVDAGGDHSCGVTVAGGVRCWGRAGVLAGAPAAAQRGFVALDAGHSHTCAIRRSGPGALVGRYGGRVTCWGSNTFGQVDAPGGGFTQVSAGWRHSCGRLRDATVVCWGSDASGQAPRARLETLSLTLADATVIRVDPDVADHSIVAASGRATLAYTFADHSTSGPDAEALPADAEPDDPSDPASIGHQVDLADGSVIEVRVDSLFGFGESRTYRIDVSDPPRLTALSVVPVGSGPQCRPACPELAVDPVFDPEVFDYTVVAPADLSQLTVSHRAVRGRADVSPRDADDAEPGDQVALSTNGGFVSVAAGGSHSCGVKTDDDVVCWGRNADGQSNPPTGSFSTVAAGTNHSCGVKTDATVACWGNNGNGQSNPPAGSFRAVAAGTNHSCGVKTDASVVCWGRNANGQSNPPAGSFRAVAAGAYHSCGVKTDARVVCWGRNANGQSNPPAGSFRAVSVSTEHSCGVKTDASVVCWGNSGNGRSDAPAGSFRAVSAGRWHSCGVKTDASMVCWGYNGHGQSNAPAGSFSAVSVSTYHSCGIRTDASVVCWGARSPVLEPAMSETVTVTVTGTTDPALSVLYEVTIARPRPVLDRSGRASRQPPGGSDARTRSEQPGPSPHRDNSKATAVSAPGGLVCPGPAAGTAQTVLVEIADAVLLAGINRRLANAPARRSPPRRWPNWSRWRSPRPHTAPVL